MADGGQDRIRLQTIQGKVGYKIVKFEGIAEKPATANQESVIKIFNQEQTSIDAEINFDDSNLLGVVSFVELSSHASSGPTNIIFDNEIFNQDIFVSHKDGSAGESANYYIELEVIPLDDAGAEYTTLKGYAAELVDAGADRAGALVLHASRGRP